MMNKEANYAPSGTVGRPRSGREPVTVRLDPSQLKWIDKRAIRLKTGRSDVVRWAIAQIIAEEQAAGIKQ